METKELRKLSNEELNKKIVEAKKDLFDKRMMQANGSLEKTAELRKLRKDVARMKTILNERTEGGNE